MSRIGKKLIEIPSNVEVNSGPGKISIKGPKGTLTLAIHPNVAIIFADNKIQVNVKDPGLKQDRALWGLHRALVANMVRGVTEGFEKKLEISGVGFRAQVSGNKLVLNVGFSHPVELLIPEGVTVQVDKNMIIVSGSDKLLVGHFAAVVRTQKPPEPYKGKGIKYEHEVVRRKAGKAAKAVGAG